MFKFAIAAAISLGAALIVLVSERQSRAGLSGIGRIAELPKLLETRAMISPPIKCQSWLVRFWRPSAASCNIRMTRLVANPTVFVAMLFDRNQTQFCKLRSRIVGRKHREQVRT